MKVIAITGRSGSGKARFRPIMGLWDILCWMRTGQHVR